MMSSSEIRRKFLDYFRSKKHEIVPSAPIVVKNDPTLMFTNAGMNQFKDYFLGNRTAAHLRVADTQKCLRVSGKHNDLEEVGVDTYHHTMFEMLGNWSFGDYFKKEAIAWSWELLTEVYGIPKDKLYVSIFEGDVNENLPKDEEALTEWKKWISEDRILPGSKKDNFWEMGDTGPCGPCTEIHVDCRTDEERKQIDGKELVNKDHPQVIEIWNIVFIQFNRLKDGSLEPLPAKHVDTGMGLERLVRVLQQKNSNYDTDIFSGTIAATEKITNRSYADASKASPIGGGLEGAIAFRVIADHIRAIGFTIADGQLPGNTGAGYVIRRILRRAVRYYYSYLDYKQPLLHQLMPVLAKQFETVFPELIQQLDFVTKVVKEEEDSFLRTLDKGLKRIDDIIQSASSKTITGKDAFELYDTYGFPIDLTRLIAVENNLQVDEKSFENEMQKQKQRSRAATAVDTEDWIVAKEGSLNEFVGYDSLESNSSVLKYRKIKAKGKEGFQLVLDTTPFYAESGGQVGDTGVLIFGEEAVNVIDTKKDNDLIIHFTDKLPKEISGTVVAKVAAAKRKNIARHHSVTHLLHAALRNVLGNHVAQKGSLVNDEYLRFDFSHFSKVTDVELQNIEALVNEKIRENIPVVIKSMTKDEAVALGAMALFGEKYGDVVRVVIIDPEYSVELCGGTHVASTGELGLFKLTHEAAIAAGVRRIEAVCGKMAEKYLNQQISILNQIKNILKQPKNILSGVEKLINEKIELEKKVTAIESAKANELIEKILRENVKQIKDVFFVTAVIEVCSIEIFRKIIFTIKNRLKNVVIILGARIDGKSAFQILLSPKPSSILDLNMNAKNIVNQAEPYMKERNFGGNNKMVQGSAVFTEDLEVVIKKMSDYTESWIEGLYQTDNFR